MLLLKRRSMQAIITNNYGNHQRSFYMRFVRSTSNTTQFRMSIVFCSTIVRLFIHLMENFNWSTKEYVTHATVTKYKCWRLFYSDSAWRCSSTSRVEYQRQQQQQQQEEKPSRSESEHTCMYKDDVCELSCAVSACVCMLCVSPKSVNHWR